MTEVASKVAANKVSLVTGASAGIGEATARALMAAGYRVYAGARRLDRMAPLAAAGATLLKLDVTDDASMLAAVNTIKSEAGRIDVLVNNAGYGSYGALEDVPLAEARRQFEVNVFGLARLCQLALPVMRAQKSGKIVNVTSIGGGRAFRHRCDRHRAGRDPHRMGRHRARGPLANVGERRLCGAGEAARADACHCGDIEPRLAARGGRTHDRARGERAAAEDPLRHRRRRAHDFVSAPDFVGPHI
jgi:NAD(P)-dependent dehydrogenase (short-subunit alcohol dehydrogenase family)